MTLRSRSPARLGALTLFAVVALATFAVPEGGRPRGTSAAESTTATMPTLPHGIQPLIDAYAAGRPLPLQSLLDSSEAYYDVASAAVPAPDATDPVAAVLDLFGALHRDVPPHALPGILQLAALPTDLGAAVASLAAATADSQRFVERAMAGAEPDWALLFRAERVKLAAVEQALPVLLRYTGGVAHALPVSVCDVIALDLLGGDDLWLCDYVLQVDVGGNDRYENHAGGNFMLDTSALLVDAAGHDVYFGRFADHTAVTGSGFFGVGALIDAAGDDVYDEEAGEGAAVNGAGDSIGVGFLADLGGTDTVRAVAGLHAAVNGAAWVGAGHLLLQDGDDWVEGETESSGGVNGAGWGAPGRIVGLGGSRTYLARDAGRIEGGALNGGSWGSGNGVLVDVGGASRYESWAGKESGANGGASGGSGLLVDLGGGPDTYFVRAGERSDPNGASDGGHAVLFDDGGTDTYDEDPAVGPQQDVTLLPKGEGGAQIDADPTTAGRLGPLAFAQLAAKWPAPARAVHEALVDAGREAYSLPSLNDITKALAQVDAATVEGSRGGSPMPLVRLAALRAGPQGPAASTGLAELAAVPPPLQDAVAELLLAFEDAEALAGAAAADPDPTSPSSTALFLEARGLLLRALERTRPVFDAFAGQRLATVPVDICGLLNIDLTGQPTTYTCDYAFQVTLGGDSVYENRAGGTLPGGKAAFLLDAAGNDLYLGPVPPLDLSHPPEPAIAGSTNGNLGFLADLAGNDRYEPRCPDGCTAMGAAMGGAGALVDAGGDDVYRLAGPANASAANGGSILGNGFLADLGGHDVYEAQGPLHSSLNAAAFLSGTGFLFDRDGDDVYYAVAGEHGVVNAGATSAGTMLLDLAGNDHYWGESGHHGQTNGAGFFSVPGTFLIDRAGDDTYTGVAPIAISTNGNYYIVGRCPLPRGCAHGVAALVDLGGLDAYVEWETMAEAGDAHARHGAGAPTSAMPAPQYDLTVVPKGDLGAQLDVSASLG